MAPEVLTRRYDKVTYPPLSATPPLLLYAMVAQYLSIAPNDAGAVGVRPVVYRRRHLRATVRLPAFLR